MLHTPTPWHFDIAYIEKKDRFWINWLISWLQKLFFGMDILLMHTQDNYYVWDIPQHSRDTQCMRSQQGQFAAGQNKYVEGDT